MSNSLSTSAINLSKTPYQAGDDCQPIPQKSPLQQENLNPTKDGSYSPSQEEHPTAMKQSFVSIWWFELTCCVLAICMLAAIIATLLPSHRNPIPSLPYHLSINTVISIFATVLKMCNVIALAEGLSQLKWEHFKQEVSLQHLTYYDAATRGPWGCLQLLLTLRSHGLLTILGAVASISVIIVDPFAQQLVAYYSCNVPATNGSFASIPRSSYYNEVGYVREELYRSLTLDQRSALVNGFFNPELVRVPINCPSGNCTFDSEYVTLSFCSECTDLTDELQMSWTYWNVSDMEGSQYEKFGFNTTLPSGLSAGISDTDDYNQVYLNIGRNYTYYRSDIIPVEIVLGKIPDNASLFSLDPPSYAANFGVNAKDTRGSCELSWQNRIWGCRGYGAARCTITPCVKVLKASMSNGTFEEKTEASYSRWFKGQLDSERGEMTYRSVMADLSCVNASTRNTLRAMGYNATGARFMAYDVATSPLNGSLVQLRNLTQQEAPGLNLTKSQISMIPDTCIYQMDRELIIALDTFIQEYLTTYIGSRPPRYNVEGSVQAMKIFNGSYMTMDSINEIFTGMVDSFSIGVRQWDADGKSTFNQPARGVLWITETCVRVRWWWIVYPIAVTLLTICFLALVLLQTETADDKTFARGWKSSLLPFIYHGMSRSSANDKAVESHVDDIRTMDKRAKNEMAQIQPASPIHGIAKLRQRTPSTA